MKIGKEFVGAYLNNECIGYGVISTITGNVCSWRSRPSIEGGVWLLHYSILASEVDSRRAVKGD